MKFLHLADLHIGKRVHEQSMLDDQRHVFDQLHRIAREQGVGAVLIAGDVFDRPVPGGEALMLCEELYLGFIEAGLPVYVVPGNHDSAEQVAYNSSLARAAGLHVARAYTGAIERFRIPSEDGPIDIHLLPFIRPTDVRMAHESRRDEVKTHDDAVRIALEENPVDDAVRNVLVAHQFVIAGDKRPETCDSEVISIGGADSVQASNFDAFDYVALGHLHGPQQIGRPTIRYAGSPLKYSFSECRHTKSATIVDLSGGEVHTETVALEPLHEMREVTASFAELEAGIDSGDHTDYLHITLKDESLFNAIDRVRTLYPNCLKLDWADSAASAAADAGLTLEAIKSRPIEQLFSDYVEAQLGREIHEDEYTAFMDIAGAKEGDAR